MINAVICNSKMSECMLGAAESHRKTCMYEQMNYMKTSTKFLVMN